MRTVLLIALNTLRVIFRRPSNLIVYLALPALGVPIALGVGAVGGQRPVQVGVAVEDTGLVARDLVGGMGAWGRFQVKELDTAAMERAVAAGELDCGLVIPAGFEERLLAGQAEMVRVISTRGAAVSAWLASYVDSYVASVADLVAASSGDRGAFDAMYAARAGLGATLAVSTLEDASVGRRIVLSNLGYLIMFLMLGASLTTQIVLAEKRSRTYHRVLSAPVNARAYVAGNGTAAMAIITAQVVLIHLILRLVVRADTGVPDLLLLLVLLLFGLVAVALGMLVMSVSRNTLMSGALGTLILSPTCMLAGCFWPIELMPPFLQRLALFLPQRWVLDAVALLQEGRAFTSILPHLAVIVAFAVALGLVASWRIARTEEAGQFV